MMYFVFAVVFGFAVTVVGHRMVPIKYEKSFAPRLIKSDEGLFRT